MAAAAPDQGAAAQANVGPNVVMNANAGGLGAVEDDEGEGGNGGQRDILDWFYVASRILVKSYTVFGNTNNCSYC
jgi:hypothetical protein